MSRAAGGSGRAEGRWERSVRIALWVALGLSWLVTALYMWDAVTAVPPGERLEAAGALGAPSARTWVTAAIFSGMELGLVLALLWPWRPELYASRLGVAGLGLVTWFIMTAPMDVGPVDRVHRLWLAFMAAATLLAIMALVAGRAWRRLARRDRESLRSPAVD